MKNKKIKLPIDKRPACYRCGWLDVEELSDKTIVCKNSQCMALTRYDWETNTLETKFDVKDVGFKSKIGIFK